MPTRGKNKRRTVRLKMPDGSILRRDIYAPTDAELDDKEDALKLEAAKGAISSTMPFSDWCDQWLEVYKKPTVDENTYKTYKSIIENHIKPSFVKMRINAIKHIHLQACVNRAAGSSKSLVMKINNTLSQLFVAARINGLISADPTEGIRPPGYKESGRRSVTETERSAIMTAAASHRAGPWVMLMLCCGLRRGETVPLEWADIDFEKKTVRVNKAVCFTGNKGTVKSTKTSAGVRTLPAPDILISALQKHPRHISSSLVFPTASGKMMTLTNIRRLWDSFVREADRTAGAEIYRNKIKKPVLPGKYDDKENYQYELTPHYLRHTYATDLYSAEIDLKTAQYLLGHADIKVTANIYTHASKSAISAAAGKINQYYAAGQLRDGSK